MSSSCQDKHTRAENLDEVTIYLAAWTADGTFALTFVASL